MFARLSDPILALLICLAALVLPQSAAAQTDPGPAIETEPALPAARGDDPIAVAAYGTLFDANMKVIDPSPEFLRLTLDLYIKRLTGEAKDRVRASLGKYRDVLAEARRLLDDAVDNAPVEYRTSMLENVPINREIMAAWKEHAL